MGFLLHFLHESCSHRASWFERFFVYFVLEVDYFFVGCLFKIYIKLTYGLQNIRSVGTYDFVSLFFSSSIVEGGPTGKRL